MPANGGVLYVKNWARFQHYKLNDPPWIKLHRKLLSDYAFSRLSDRDKGHLMLLWLYAASSEGTVPHDEAFLRRRLGLHSNPDLKLFIDQGWLSENPIISSSKDSITEGETEKRRKDLDLNHLTGGSGQPRQKLYKKLQIDPPDVNRNREIAAAVRDGKIGPEANK